jgi:predicted phosphodiesterase
MKIAILSDIHANLAALEAVLQDIKKNGGVHWYWNLGDIVDYGPDPHECVQKVRELEAVSIVGNHDLAVLGRLDYQSEFPPQIAYITSWTEKQLTAADKEYLNSLPMTMVSGKFTMAHASPRDPVWEYMYSEDLARENLSFFQTQSCLVGHTHVPSYYQFKGNDQLEDKKPYQAVRSENWFALLRQNRRGQMTVQLNEDRFIINPGGIGQPRDGDPRAAYAIYDTDAATVELRRVEYDITATQKKMQAAGLPQRFIDRLAERG